MDIWRALQILKNRRWTILITAILACVLIMLSDRSPEDRFRSTAKLLFNTQGAATPFGETNIPLNTSVGWLGDPTILHELMVSQDFLEKHVIASTQLKANWLVLRDQLDMRSLSNAGGSALIEIGAEDGDAKQAQIIAQAVADGFAQYVPELLAREQDGNRKFLEKLVGEAKGQLDDAEASILLWQEHHHALSAGEAYGEQMKMLSQLEQERAMVAQRLASSQARHDVLTHYHPGDTPPLAALEGSETGRNNQLAELQAIVAQEHAKLDKLREMYKPDEPNVQSEEHKVQQLSTQLQAEIAVQVKSMLVESGTVLKESQAQLKSLDASMAAMRGQMSAGRDQLDFAKRQRDIELWDKNYQELISSLYRARMVEQASARRGAITLLEAPMLGARISVVPKTFQKRLSVAILVGVVLGVAVALVLEYISRSLKVTTNVEELLELRVLGTVPRLSKEAMAEWRDTKNHLVTGSPRTNGKSAATPAVK